MKRTLLAAIITFCFLDTHAQDFDFGSFTLEELQMTKYAKDTSAHAVVLAEYGKSNIINDQHYIPIVHEYHVKIKIFDAKGFNKANVSIPIYKSDGDAFERVSDIKGVTTYTDEKGSVQKVELDPKKAFTVNENKYWDNVKFTMPNVRAGCIIEYSYTLTSPYKQTYKGWAFQDDIPKVRSEYRTRVPAIYAYNIALIGALNLQTNDQKREIDCFNLNGLKCDCTLATYVMTDIPAFIEEDHMTSSKNFISAIKYELKEYYDLNTGARKKMSLEWADVDVTYRTSESLGRQFKRKDLLKDVIAPVVAGKTDPLEKAKAVYSYIQKNIKWNGIRGIYTEGAKKALEKHTGLVADVNHALILALTSAGIDAEPVLLSTRDHGVTNKLFPVITEFNYVIAKANIGDRSYLLDATDPLLSFGMLPMHCLNDQGRVMSSDKPSYWIDLNKDQKQSTTYIIDLTFQENGKLKGKLVNVHKGYSAFERRKWIKKFNSTDEYIEDLDEKLPRIKILNAKIANLDTLDMPLTETFEVDIDAFDKDNNGAFTFNPFIFDRITTNPFKLDERTFPVDWGMPSDTKYVLTMHLPKGYSIENPPQDVAFAMPKQVARFLTSYNPQEDGFSFSHFTQFGKAVYTPDEYAYLKELYNRIILSEKVEMVFKKKI